MNGRDIQAIEKGDGSALLRINHALFFAVDKDVPLSRALLRFEYAEDLISLEHPARALWEVLGTLDLAPFTASAKSLEGHVGRPVHSAWMLLTRWLYAVATGIGSARAIAKLVETDPGFRWIVGDVKVSHHGATRPYKSTDFERPFSSPG